VADKKTAMVVSAHSAYFVGRGYGARAMQNGAQTLSTSPSFTAFAH
jgi:hypothetical protein